jgi:hypothetical protein
MKNRFSLVLFVLVIVFIGFYSCTKDRIFTDESGTVIIPKPDTDISFGIIRINEYVAKGSLLASNVSAGGVDWIELFNTRSSAIQLESGKWFLTDDLANPSKFEIPAITLDPSDHYLLFCDGPVPFNGQVHVDFSLSSAGEQIGLYYKLAGNYIPIDTVSFGLQTESNLSNARIPDGSSNWQYPINPTPGAPNQ